jgi:transcriptional regulator with XRE-family HTH domain/quercetin dioxygenase-like cupin family protein
VEERTETDVPAIGARLRAERTRRGVTVRGLARDIGVSASLISQIETQKSQPSVSTLYAITTARSIPIEDLFGSSDGHAHRPDEVAAASAGDPPSDDARIRMHPPAARAGGVAERGATPASADGSNDQLRVVGPDRGRAVGPLVPPADRELLTLDSGVTWERLGQLPGVHIDFLLITYQPGGTSSSSGELMRHTGTEYGYLISGELILTLGFDEHRLTPGDSVCFDSATPHRLRNDGAVPAVGVWFVVERG